METISEDGSQYNEKTNHDVIRSADGAEPKGVVIVKRRPFQICAVVCSYTASQKTMQDDRGMDILRQMGPFIMVHGSVCSSCCGSNGA